MCISREPEESGRSAVVENHKQYDVANVRQEGDRATAGSSDDTPQLSEARMLLENALFKLNTMLEKRGDNGSERSFLPDDSRPLHNPQGIAYVSCEDVFWVSDTQNQRIAVFNATGSIQRFIKNPTGKKHFYPTKMNSMDDLGVGVVHKGRRHELMILDSGGELIKTFDESFENVRGLAFNKESQLTIILQGRSRDRKHDENRKILIFDKAYQKLREIVLSNVGFPIDIACNHGQLFVLDNDKGLIIVFDFDGKELSQIDTGTKAPVGITSVGDEKLFVMSNHTLPRVTEVSVGDCSVQHHLVNGRYEKVQDFLMIDGGPNDGNSNRPKKLFIVSTKIRKRPSRSRQVFQLTIPA